MNEERAGEEVLETHDIGIAGMTCDNCVRRVDKALRAVPGVKQVNVNRALALASVTFDAAVTNIPGLHDALLKSGYKPTTALPNAGVGS